MKPIDQPRSNLTPPEEEAVDISGYLDFLVGARWLILGVAAVITLIGVAYAFLATPVYKADILIQVEESSDSAKSLLGDVSSLFDIKTEAATEIEILQSRLVVSRAVDTLHLYFNAEPRYFPVIGARIAAWNSDLSEPGIGGYGGFAWGNEHIDVKSFDVPEKLYGKRFDLEFLGHASFRLTSPDGDHVFEGSVGRPETFQLPEGTVALDVSSIYAKPGIRFTLTRSSRLETIEKLQEQLSIFEKTKQSGVIDASLTCTKRVQCRDIMHSIGKEYISQNIERKAADAEQSLEFLNVQLPDLKRQLENSEEKYTRFRDAHGTIDLSAEGQQMLQQSATVREKLLELQVQKEDLLTRFSPTHPSVVAIDKQISALAGAVNDSEHAIRNLPDVERQAVGLMRDIQVNTELYTGLLNNAQQLKVIKAGKTGTVRLVDDAALPERPVKPKKLLVVCLSGIAGVILGIVVAYARKTCVGGLSDPHEVELLTGLDVLVTIPHSTAQEAMVQQSRRKGMPPTLLAHREPHDPAVESLRSLRTAFQFAMLGAQNNILMITGPTAGVGKSFVSANFAEVMAAGGKKVLLIDGDLHRGRLNEYFQAPHDSGLSDLISGDKTIEEVTRHHIGSGVDFIPTGTLPLNPSELILSGALRAQFEELSKRYDLVIIDSPPVLPVSDAQVLGSLAGTVFLIARYRVSRLGEIHESIKRLGLAGVNVKGIVFNGIKLNASRYAYGSKYGRFRHEQYAYYAYGTQRKG